MAKQEVVIEVDIQGTPKVESMRTQMRKLREELARLPEGTAEFNRVQRQLGDLKDRMDDLGKSVNTVSGAPLERLNNSFGLVGNSLMSLDFDAAVTGLNGMASAISDVKMDDIVNGFKNLGTSLFNLGKALLTNPIFLIATAITAVGVALYKYGETMPFVTDETKKLTQATHDATIASEKSLKAFDLEERKLRALGAAEEDIIKIRRQRTQETLLSSVNELKAQQKQLEELQKSYEASQQRIAQSTVRGGGVIRMGLESIGKAFGLVASDEQVADQTKNIDELKAKIAEYEVQILELNKKESDIQEKRIEKANKEKENLEKNLIDRNKLVQKYLNEDEEIYQLAEDKKTDIDKAELEARLLRERENIIGIGEMKSKYNDIWYQMEAQKQLKNADELSQKLLAGEKAFQDAKLNIAASTINGLISLNDLLTTAGILNAEESFKVGKALQLAQATVSAITGTQNAFTTAAASPITTAFPGYPFIMAGVAAAAGAAQIAKIAATKFNKGGGSQPAPTAPSGGGGGSMGGSTSAPMLDLSFLNNQTNQPQPLQAYVLATNVSTAQEANEKIKDQSRIIK
jgi:hypothetical protein